MSNNILRVYITGPESTGKTDLSRSLSEFTEEPWVREYARDYIQNGQDICGIEDLERIATEQLRRQEKAESMARHLIICDTGMEVIQIWAEDKFGKCPEWIVNSVQQQNAAVYLLCIPDLPWEPDSQRQDQYRRAELLLKYRDLLKESSCPVIEISGFGQARLDRALDALYSSGILPQPVSTSDFERRLDQGNQ